MTTWPGRSCGSVVPGVPATVSGAGSGLTSAVIEVLCGDDSDCDDDNSCTSDECDDGTCSNDPLPQGRPCSDAPGPGTCDGQGNCVPLGKS